MIYFTMPTKAAIPAITAGRLGYIDTPHQRNYRPIGAVWCADNGCFNDTRFREDHWWRFLTRHADEAATCVFATAPDVLGDADATLERSRPWLPRIRELSYPAAYVAQDGAHNLPWDDFDALFIGGSNTFKLGPKARKFAAQAHKLGKHVHMGRVNSLKRWRYAEAIGCHSCDGTHIKFAPTDNLANLLSWVDDLHKRPAFDLKLT